MSLNNPMIGDFTHSRIAEILAPYIVDLAGTHEELISSLNSTLDKLQQVPENQLDFRYQADKWSIKELMMHLVDTTQILALRLLAIARGDCVQMPVMDENLWVQRIDYSQIGLEYIVEGYVNQLKVIQWQLLNVQVDPDSYIICNQTKIHYHEMIKYIIGHERLHLKSLFDKYLISSVVE